MNKKLSRTHYSNRSNSEYNNNNKTTTVNNFIYLFILFIYLL